MNVQPSYTLASPAPTSRVLRTWAQLSRGTFSIAIFLIDVSVIVATAFITGIIYYLAVYGDVGDMSSYGQVGVLAASIFAVSNVFRGEYRLPNFFAFRPHARRTIQLWNVTLICLLMLGFMAQTTVNYSRGWIVVFYLVTLAALIVLRFAIVRITAMARAAGLISAHRICLIGTGAHIGAFVQHYEPWTLGLNIVGCRFLTPTALTASAETRRTALDRDLADAVASVRALEPDAIYLLLPWSATEIIQRCAETFLALPVEIHLGPEQILHKFDEVELAKVGPLASLQLTRLPLTRVEVVQKRLFDLVCSALGLLALTPLFILVAILVKLDSPGPVFFVQRRYGFNQQPFRIIKFRTMRVRRRRRGDASDPRRSAADAHRPLAAALEHRRDPAALQRACRRHVARRAAPARAVARPRIRAPHLALRAPPQRQAGHYRLGADQRLPWRNRQRRKARETRGIRPVLYR